MFDTGVLDRGISETVCCLADAESDVGLVELIRESFGANPVLQGRVSRSGFVGPWG